MNTSVDRKEQLYFAMKALFSVALLVLLAASLGSIPPETWGVASFFIPFLFYVVVIALFFIVQKMFLVAALKGNGVEVTERQFPAVYARYREMGEALGMAKLPKLFLVQEGGALNAFAVRFSCKNYIAIYSDIFALLDDDMESLAFVLGHEMGHVKRNHASRRFWTMPSSLIPFLTAAWSRACERTCDNIGFELSKEKKANGLVLLAAGKDLYRKIDVDEYLASAALNDSDLVKFIGIFLSHPFLPKRLGNIREKYGVDLSRISAT